MKRKRQIILGLMLVLAVAGGLYASASLTTTASVGVTVNGDEIVVCDSAASQPDWDSVLTPVAETETLRPTAAGDETGIASQQPVLADSADRVYLMVTGMPVTVNPHVA